MQLGDELLHEETEGVGVRVDLAHGHVYPPMVADASEYLQQWVDAPFPHGVGFSLFSPLHVAEVGHVQEGLVNVNDGVALIQQFQHALGKLMPDHEAPGGVGKVSNPLDFTVAHPEPESHYVSHISRLDGDIMLQLYGIYYLSRVPYVIVIVQLVLNLVSDGLEL